MQMISVNSSDIQSVGYSNSVLRIKFHSGGLYEYTNVPQEVYYGLINSGSKGKYFHTFIRGRYGEKRIA